MNTIRRNMNRRSFLKLPALLPLIAFGSAFRSRNMISNTNASLERRWISWSGRRIPAWPRAPVRRSLKRSIDLLRFSIPGIRQRDQPFGRFKRSAPKPSRELREVLDAYDYWERRTGGVFSIRPGGPDTPRTSTHWERRTSLIMRQRLHEKHGRRSMRLLLNIGGDIVVWGRSCEIAIADPDAWYDNAPPIANDQSSKRGSRHERDICARRASDRSANATIDQNAPRPRLLSPPMRSPPMRSPRRCV